MTRNQWTVDPTSWWKDSHLEFLLEANVPGTEQCQETLTGIRCELKAGHEPFCEHMVHMVFDDVDDGPETADAG